VPKKFVGVVVLEKRFKEYLETNALSTRGHDIRTEKENSCPKNSSFFS
jgi:hypothetical protein